MSYAHLFSLLVLLASTSNALRIPGYARSKDPVAVIEQAHLEAARHANGTDHLDKRFVTTSTGPYSNVPAYGSNYNGYTAYGCWVEATSLFGFGAPILRYSFPSSAQTIEMCLNTCYSKGYNYAGLENGVNCLCDNQYYVLSNAQYDSTFLACNLGCAGNLNENCGGVNAMMGFYNAGGYANYLASATSQSQSQSRSQSASQSASASVAAALSISQSASVSAAASLSASRSASAAAYATVSVSQSQSASASAAAALSLSQSASASAAVSASVSRSISLSASASASAAAAPGVITTTLSNNWAYQYTYWDPSSIQLSTLGGTVFTSTSMTPLLCTSTCDSQGYTYAGLEWGNTCQCGNQFTGIGYPIADSYGQTAQCTGASGVACGGTNALLVYARNSGYIQTSQAASQAASQTVSASVASSVAASQAVSQAASLGVFQVSQRSQLR